MQWTRRTIKPCIQWCSATFCSPHDHTVRIAYSGSFSSFGFLCLCMPRATLGIRVVLLYSIALSTSAVERPAANVFICLLPSKYKSLIASFPALRRLPIPICIFVLLHYPPPARPPPSLHPFPLASFLAVHWRAAAQRRYDA